MCCERPCRIQRQTLADKTPDQAMLETKKRRGFTQSAPFPTPHPKSTNTLKDDPMSTISAATTQRLNML